MAVVVADDAFHRGGQGDGRLAHAHERLLGAIDLRHVQAERDRAQGRLARVLGHRGLAVEREAEHRRRAGRAGGQYQPPRDGAGHEAQARGVLLHIAGAPGGVLRHQRETQLGVMGAGELVQLARAGHFLQHLRELGLAADGIGEGPRLHHELGVFDLVERAGAVGQLHAGLERAVALPGLRRLPLLRRLVQALDRERLAAGAPCGRQCGQRMLARDRRLQRDGREHIDQGVEPGLLFLQGDGGRRHRVEDRIDALGHLWLLGHHHFRLARRVAPRRPGVPRHQRRKQQPAEDGEADGE